MISQQHRFHRRNQVAYVYKKGSSVRQQTITLKYIRTKEHESYRAGVVVSKKVHKSAVVRNRIRRRVYEIVRTNTALIPKGTDLIITIFNVDIATMKHQELRAQVMQMLKKIR